MAPVPAALSHSLSGTGARDVVLVHGWCCDRASMAPLAQGLAADHRVLSLDLRGHGQSPRGAAPAQSIEEFADDVLAVGAGAGLRAPVVVGHSLGGLVALAALDRGAGPAGPVGAILLDAAPIAHPRGKAFWADQVDRVAEDHDGSLRRGFARSVLLETDSADYTDVVETMGATPADVAAGGARAMADYDGAAALGRLAAPALVIHAASAERDLDRLVPDRRLLTLGRTVGAGHFHQCEVPDQVLAMIRRWLAVTELGPVTPG